MLITDAIRAVLAGHRHTEWRVWLLDEHDQPVRLLTELADDPGHLEHNIFADIRGGGSLNLQTVPGVTGFGIDWGSARFRVEQLIDGIDDPIPWGVYLPEVSEIEYHDEHSAASCTVPLMDKTLVLAQDQPTETYSLPAGTPIVETVIGIITGLGETRIVAEPSPLTLPVARSYPVDEDTSWMRIINDLLSVANYRAVWCDRDGQYRLSPYRPAGPGDAPLWTFAYGPGALYMPRWSESEDWMSVPNRVICTTQGDSTAAGLRSVATNNNPDSKYSVPRRGRIITRKEIGVEAADQASLDGYTLRRLESLTTSVTNASVTTAPVPLWTGDRVDLVTPSRPGPVACVSSSWSLEMTAGALMDHQWREGVAL